MGLQLRQHPGKYFGSSAKPTLICFWRPLFLLHQSALRLTHTCLATTASATPAITAIPASATLVMAAMEDLATLVTLPPTLLATPVCPPPPLSLPWELPLLPSLLSEELMPVLDDTLPTLLGLSMSPRGRLRLIPTFWDMGYPGYGHGGCGSYSPSAGVNIAGYAPAALPAVPGAYAGAGRYCANSAGTIHCA